MPLLIDYIRLIKECVIQFFVDDPLIFSEAAFVGMVAGSLFWMLFPFWARLWNKSYEMTPLQHVLAGFALPMAMFCSVTCFALKDEAGTIRTQIESWQAGIVGDHELKYRLRQQLFEEIAGKGLEDMKGIPDPRTLAPGERWELVYRNQETQILVGEVYTQGTLQSFAEAHPLLFIMVFFKMAPDLIATEIRIKTNENHVYSMDDAGKVIAAKMSAQLQLQIWKGVIATRAVLITAFLGCLLVPLTLVAMSAFNDIRVHLPNRD